MDTDNYLMFLNIIVPNLALDNNSYEVEEFCCLMSQADGLEAVERVGVAAEHRGLLHDKTVFQLIQKWLGAEPVVSKHSKTSKVADTYAINPMVL